MRFEEINKGDAFGTWVGKSVPRREDAELLSGQARFIADIHLPAMLHAAFLRSPHARARIVSIDVSAAAKVAGVRAIMTGADIPSNIGPLPGMHFYDEHRETPTYPLAREIVRYAGEPIAVVAATSRYIAEDALELIEVEFEKLPAVGGIDAALMPEAPRLYDGWKDNVACVSRFEIGQVDLAFDDADIVVEEQYRIQRCHACPLETRGVVAEWSFDGRSLTFWTSSQIINQTRDYLSQMLGIAGSNVRIRIPRLGGGFGAKFHFYVEEPAIALLARIARAPVRWIEDRLEAFTATVHARDEIIDIKLAARSDGRITGIIADVKGDLGSMHHTVSMGPVWLTAAMMTNVYDIPNARSLARALVTNKPPLGSYRGWGQPEANFAVERLVDRLASKLGMDPTEVRRMNYVPDHKFPYKGLFHTFDSGRYSKLHDQSIEQFGYSGWLAKRDAARRDGRYVGIGMSFYVENTALGPSRGLNAGKCTQGGYDIARIRMETSGDVYLYTGLCEMGQGMTNALAQVCADALGLTPNDVTVVTGDSAITPYTGYGTGASRSATVGAAAVMKAATCLRARILEIARHWLQEKPENLLLANRGVSVKGDPTRFVSFAEIGEAAYRQIIRLPEDTEAGLEGVASFDPAQMAWPYGTHLVAVEVDVKTGLVSFLDYLLVHDTGTVVNAMIVDGQLHGGIAQGIGQALYEELSYNDEGQLQNATFADFLIPTACEVPTIRMGHMVTESPLIPGGMKGVGEAGIIGAPAAIVGAIEDALRPLIGDIHFNATPITPERILDAIQRGSAK